MKTTLHLPRPPRPIDPDPRPSVGPATLRLGLVLSLLGAAFAVAVETVADVPALVVLGPVVVLGFVLSWHASGRPERPEHSRER